MIEETTSPSLCKKPRSESFKASTDLLFQRCSRDCSAIYDLHKTANYIGFHKRRFYDVIHVLDALGCCDKLDADSFKFNGLSCVKGKILQMCQDFDVFNPDKSLSEVLPPEDCTSITDYTKVIILCFVAMGIDSLDIKQLSYYLTRNGGRNKTVLCKLYQISQILDAIGIITKTNNISEIYLNERYRVPLVSHVPKEDGFMSVVNLLSRTKNYTFPFVLHRRKEFQMEAQLSAANPIKK